jgi:hypothetical protein
MTDKKADAPKLDAKVLRGRLTSALVEALDRDFTVYGHEIIEKLREEAPAKYAEIVARLMPVQNEISVSGDPSDFSDTRDETDLANGLIAQRDRNVVPNDKLRQRVLAIHHKALADVNNVVDAAAAAQDEPVKQRKINEVEAFKVSGFKL